MKKASITYEDYLKEKNSLLIDVRSPKEYEEENILGSVNIPILDNEERANVGTAYKQESPDKAKSLGIKYMANKLEDVYSEISALSKKYDKLIFFCAKGGMRSSSIVSLMKSLGTRAYKLEGGYRSYRQYILAEIPKLNEGIKYIMVHGRTGIGKTKILEGLEEKGLAVLNLEALADHKGSSFGAICERRTQSQKRFESLLYKALLEQKDDYFFVECESKRIGNLYIPDSIFDSMKSGDHIFLETDMETRLKVLEEDYWSGGNGEMLDALWKIKRYMSEEDYEKYKFQLENKDYRGFSQDIMLNYYDRLYNESIKKYDFSKDFYYTSVEDGVEQINTWYEKEYNK